VIHLAKSAFYTKEVRSICLPKPRRNPEFTNEVGIVTGWGTIYYGGPHSATLTEVLVPIWNQQDCKSAYTQPIEVITYNVHCLHHVQWTLNVGTRFNYSCFQETNLCAGVRAGGRDSCQGDSGKCAPGFICFVSWVVNRKSWINRSYVHTGGPLQLEIDGYWSVVGIVSWGIRCAEPGYPGQSGFHID